MLADDLPADGALDTRSVKFPMAKVGTEIRYVYALWNCAKSLSKRGKGLLSVHVPYRLSVVTRILQVYCCMSSVGRTGGKCNTSVVLSMEKKLASYDNALGVLEIAGMLRKS